MVSLVSTINIPSDVPTVLTILPRLWMADLLTISRIAQPRTGFQRVTFMWEAVNTIVHDIRDNEDTVSLDTTGFEFVQHSGEEKVFVDEEAS